MKNMGMSEPEAFPLDSKTSMDRRLSCARLQTRSSTRSMTDYWLR